jgi:hypothetical protein
MSYLAINGTDVSDLVQGLKVGYETLVSEDSGRNANGDTVLDIVNRKVKLYVTFRPMDSNDMARLMSTFADYVVNASFRDVKTNTIRTVQVYTGTPEPEYYWILNNQVLYKAMELNFIEL